MFPRRARRRPMSERDSGMPARCGRVARSPAASDPLPATMVLDHGDTGIMLQLLETFCAVAQAGSLNKATETLHLTQPAITRQVQALETQLGAILLTRTSRGVAL